jgi:transcriptional regulator with XRE-family HTH domain
MVNNYFPKNLKYFRNKRHIDQQVMADDLGISRSTLSSYENGVRNPNLDMVYKIAKYLKIYDDCITKDLTIDDDPLTQQELMFNEFKDYLTENDWNIINTIAVQRKNEVDKEKQND